MPAALPVRRLPNPLAQLDVLVNRLFGSRHNPIYQSGTLVVVLWLVLLLSGLWLLLFYRIGGPWDSVAAITADPWLGNWVRGLHRYASDAAVVATAVHAARMYLQRRTWGPRTLAWVSGLVLLGLILVSGWTGFVMVWDTFGHRLAVEGARLLDVLPVLSEPVRRSFVGDRPVASAFFFLNLFLHVALPLALGLVFWLHVSRLARPVLLPPRRLGWGLVGALTALAIVVPVGMAPEADPLRLPAEIPVDWFYAFWLPLADRMSPVASWVLVLGVGAALLLVPRLTRPRPERPAPSRVDSALCTGCSQCAADCPFEAITMVPRSDGRADLVARIDPARCVSCGICAGSCAPMGVGPPGRTGRDQLREVGELVAAGRVTDRVVAFACAHGAATMESVLAELGLTVQVVECAGTVHTSAIEYVVRAGARCAVVLACPPRDCWNREGTRWLGERVHQGREAELKERVDRRRVRIVELAAHDGAGAREMVTELERALARLERPETEATIDVDTECEVPSPERVGR